MKKTLAVLALSCVASFAFGQGQVNFVNVANPVTTVSTNSVLGGAATGLTGSAIPGFYYGLFMAPVGTSDPNAMRSFTLGLPPKPVRTCFARTQPPDAPDQP